jgi:hypothetical protein
MSVLYLDTEFNGFGGQLMSLALVPDDDTESWYEELEPPPNVDLWVRQHVIPQFYKTSLRPLIFRQSFQTYLQKFTNPLIVCDWHTDAIHFCQQLIGPNHGSSLDFEFRMHVLKTPRNEPVYVHNALSDARILKAWCIDKGL